MKKEYIYNKIELLSRESKIEFGFFCLLRVMDLYKIFDNFIIKESLCSHVEGEEGYTKLANILNETRDAIDTGKDSSNYEELLNKCYYLIPMDENCFGYEATIAQNIAGTMLFILKYIIEDNDKYIKLCIDNVIEIINNLVSSQLKKKSGNVTEREYKLLLYDDEFKIELTFIEMLLTNENLTSKHDYISNHMISIG